MKNPESIFALQTVSAPVLSEKEDKLYFVKTMIKQEMDDYVSHIYEYEIASGEETPIVENNAQNFAPALYKNLLLYLSDDGVGTQVYLLDLNTKETTQLTYSKNKITSVNWLGNEGKDFIFTTELPNEVPKHFKWENFQIEDQNNKAPFYRMTTLSYQAEGAGFVDPSYTNYLCEQNIETGDVTVISRQDAGYGVRGKASSDAEGKLVCFEKRLHPDSDTNHDSGLFIYNRASEELKSITQDFTTGIFTEGAISPDGQWVALIGNPLPYRTNNQFKLYLYHIPTKKIVEIAPEWDVQYGDNSVSDYFQNINNSYIQWNKDSQSFYIQTSEFGAVKLYQVFLDHTIQDISPAKGVLSEYTVGSKETIYALLSQPEAPVQLFQRKNKQWVKLFLEVEQQYKKYSFSAYQEISYQAEDGKFIHGFLVFPAHFDENKKYPLILNIHGGPYTMHSYTFYHEAQYLAANGYAVLLINPRGSYGYGQEFTHAVYQRYGQEDYTDLMTVVDQVLLDFNWIDPKNLFVTGGSYGGYLTNWIVAHTNRFKAAVTQRSMTNLLSMIGTSDTGYFFLTDEVGGDWENYDQLWKMSPIAYAQNVNTPLLIIHSLEDRRVPFEQAQQFYASLKYFEKIAEMLVFPNSNHELSRSGRPSYRVERLKAIVEWFQQYED